MDTEPLPLLVGCAAAELLEAVSDGVLVGDEVGAALGDETAVGDGVEAGGGVLEEELEDRITETVLLAVAELRVQPQLPQPLLPVTVRVAVSSTVSVTMYRFSSMTGLPVATVARTEARMNAGRILKVWMISMLIDALTRRGKVERSLKEGRES